MVRLYHIPGECVAKGRPRYTRFGRAYTPKKTADFEQFVKQQIKSQGAEMSKGPFETTILVFKEVPKSWSKAKKEKALLGEILPTSRPDLDNYVKSIWDACNGVLYDDDSCIVNLHAKKRYAEEAHTFLIIKEVKSDE